MKLKARVLVENVVYEDLNDRTKRDIIDRATDIYSNQVVKSVSLMIKEGEDIEKIKKYLLLPRK